MPAQATQAYLGGDKALAKELGEKGRWHAAKMLAAHAEASDAIFRQRNPNKGASLAGDRRHARQPPTPFC